MNADEQFVTSPIGRFDVISALRNGSILPQNVRCPSRCRFCYEHQFSRLFPWIKTKYIEPYTERSFRRFLKIAFDETEKLKHRSTKKPRPAVSVERLGSQYYYFPQCDFFSLGLSLEQIDFLLENSLITRRIYTTGLHADVDHLQYLTKKYPWGFRVHLSLITLDPTIRSKTMHPKLEIEKVKDICRVLKQPLIYVICFNKKQIVSDIQILNDLTARNQGSYYFGKLYYNRLAPKHIKEYAISASDEFPSIVDYLATNDKRLKHISKRLILSPEPEIYAWRWRRSIRKLLKPCRDSEQEVIFCTHSVYQLIRSLFKKSFVVPLSNSIGGNIDFASGLTLSCLAQELHSLASSSACIRHVYLPSPILCIDGKYDFNLDGLDKLKKSFPKIKFHVLDVPYDVLRSTVELKHCVSFYNSPIARRVFAS